VPDPSTPPIETWAVPHTTVVTGAAGWLGRALTHRLLADPQRVQLRLLAHSTAEAEDLRAFVGDRKGVDIVIGDVAKADTAARLLHGVGTDSDVLHTAGIIHPKSVRQFYDVNTNGTRHLTDAAARANAFLDGQEDPTREAPTKTRRTAAPGR